MTVFRLLSNVALNLALAGMTWLVGGRAHP